MTQLCLMSNISKTAGDRDLSDDGIPIGNGWESNGHVTDMTSRDAKGQGRDPNMFDAQYLKTAGDIDLVTMSTYKNVYLGMKWLCDR